jgi:hypothetical protein
MAFTSTHPHFIRALCSRHNLSHVSTQLQWYCHLSQHEHIIIKDTKGRVNGGLGVEDGIILLEPNDNFAMGEPPGVLGQ